MITPDMVRDCYRVLLRREPENEDVLSRGVNAPSFEVLLRNFVESIEYQTKLPEFGRIIRAMCDDADGHVDYEVSAEQLAACFARIRHEWTALGEAEPYWSVLTDEAFSRKHLDNKALDAFFASGRAMVSRLQKFVARTGRELPKGRCLEFGCGTGRVTRYLARLFEDVTAVDISSGNLKLAGENLRDAGVSNVSLHLLEAPEQLSALPDCDFLFSIITLQHNPPPLQYFILDKLFAKIRLGGGVFVQIPTHTPGYSFKIDAYLETVSRGLEMHALPMHAVFETLDRHKMTPVEVLMDDLTGLPGSHTFYAVKREY